MKISPYSKKSTCQALTGANQSTRLGRSSSQAPNCACKATAATIQIIQLFFILHNCLYHEQIVTFSFAQKTPYSDHQRIGHRRVFPFFTFLSFIQLQTWYNFIPCERCQKRTFVINCKKSALGVFMILSVITDQTSDFKNFISYI